MKTSTKDMRRTWGEMRDWYAAQPESCRLDTDTQLALFYHFLFLSGARAPAPAPKRRRASHNS